jgi:hypothetical protein
MPQADASLENLATRLLEYLSAQGFEASAAQRHDIVALVKEQCDAQANDELANLRKRFFSFKLPASRIDSEGQPILAGLTLDEADLEFDDLATARLLTRGYARDGSLMVLVNGALELVDLRGKKASRR